MDLVRDAEQFLHMVADLMGDNIGLGKVAWCLETIFQFVEKGKVDIDLLVTGTVEGASGRLGQAAGRFHRIAKEDQMRLLVGLSLLLEQGRPGCFGISENYGDKINQLLFCPSLLNWSPGGADGWALLESQEGQHAPEIPGKQTVSTQAEDRDNRPLKAEEFDRHWQQAQHAAVVTKATCPGDPHIASVFDILALSSSLPTHSPLPVFWFP